jgi:hypothetical protein
MAASTLDCMEWNFITSSEKLIKKDAKEAAMF